MNWVLFAKWIKFLVKNKLFKNAGKVREICQSGKWEPRASMST